MQQIVVDLENTEAYLDDILVHTKSYKMNIKLLQQLFCRMRQYGLKMNLKKCKFLATEIEYLGYHVSAHGLKPGTDKTAVIKEAPAPQTVKEIQSFLGLANYFRRLIPHFSAIARPLAILTSKNHEYKRGPLPDDARSAFDKLKECLITAPCIGLTDPTKPFRLYVDAATGTCNGKIDGGLGAVLTQLDYEGRDVVIGYASRTLRQHEKNYTPYLLELAAATFGIEHFYTHLVGRRFTLFTDHKPLEKLTLRQTRTLQRLQQLMMEHDFDVQYIPGKQNILGDWASRHVTSTSQTLGQHNINLVCNQNEIEYWQDQQAKDMTITSIPETIKQDNILIKKY